MRKAQTWIVKRLRKTKDSRGRPLASYAVRYISPATGQIKSEAVGSDRRRAENRQSELRQQIETGLYNGITTITFDAFVAEHLELIKSTKAAATVLEHERALQQLREACRPKTMTDIDRKTIEQFRAARLQQGNQPSTVNKILTVLKAILNLAVARSYITANPMTPKPGTPTLMLKLPGKIVVAPEQETFDTLLTACSDNTTRKAIVLLGWFAGLRSSEIAGLLWERIDFEADLLTIWATKTSTFREVPMVAPVKTALLGLQANRLKSPHVFLNPDGRPLGPSFVTDTYRILSKATGLKVTSHSMRRAFATRLAESGASPKILMGLLGHTKIETTMAFYLAAPLSAKRDAMAALVGAG